ncbi:MAG: hypothetical protein D6744_11080 [Planctomycetota bacterium]|nr:MAG: hypothetical protein D6744_11080 [Planctomycetota bacterium]
MNRSEQRLKALLQAADRAAPRPGVPDDLIRRLRVATSSSPLRLRTAAVAAVVMLALAWSWRSLDPAAAPLSGGVRPTAADGAAQRLAMRPVPSEWSIEQREALAIRTLQLLADRERLSRARRAAAEAEKRATAPYDALDNLAEGLVLLAQRQLDAGYEADAAARFERVLRVFADTPWARVAKMRLDEIEGHSASRPAARDS